MTFEVTSAGPFYSIYRGFVSDVADPLRMGRILVSVPAVFGVDPQTGDSPTNPNWAYPIMGAGAGEGFIHIPQVGDTVWVQFEDGDPDRPVWQHGSWTMRGGHNNAPRHAIGKNDNSDNKLRGTDTVPNSQFPGGPTTTQTIQTPAGRLEFNSAQGEERVVLEHKSGSRIEILPDGTVHVIAGGNKRQVTGGSLVEDTRGGATRTIEGKTTDTYGKGHDIVENGAHNATYNGKTVVTHKDVEYYANSMIIKSASLEHSVTGTAAYSYGGDVGQSIFGSYRSVILDTARWIITNSGADPVGLSIKQAHPLIGDVSVETGSDPTGLTNNKLLLRHPIGHIPGLADIVLQAVAILSLTAPLVTIGATEGILGKEPVVKAVSLLAYLNGHIHTGGTIAGFTGVPDLATTPALIAGIASTSLLVQ